MHEVPEKNHGINTVLPMVVFKLSKLENQIKILHHQALQLSVLKLNKLL